MTEACTPPQPRHLNREKPGIARGATTAPPASTCQPPTPPPRRCRTSNAVEEEKRSTTILPKYPMPARRTPPAPPAPSRQGPEQTDLAGPGRSHSRRNSTSRSRCRPPPPCALPRRPPPPPTRRPPPPLEPTRASHSRRPHQSAGCRPRHPPTRTPATRPPDPAGAAPDLEARASAAAIAADERSSGRPDVRARP